MSRAVFLVLMNALLVCLEHHHLLFLESTYRDAVYLYYNCVVSVCSTGVAAGYRLLIISLVGVASWG